MRASPLRRWRPSRGEWDRAAATHLLRRAGFGPAPGAVERALEAGVDAAVDEVLANDRHDPVLLGGVRHLLPLDDVAHLQSWWMSLILDDGAQLVERVTLMWHDHFATSNDKVDDVRMMYAQNTLLREKGMGDFRELLHEMAKDPAMLVWLDGNENKRGQANENFAREVMELFGLGIGNYDERDIQEAARAFTGWGTLGRSFTFREGDHDPGQKTIFGKRGAFGGDEAIDLILDHPACSKHVARRLLEELVHPSPEGREVDALARELVDNDWHIGRTVAGLLRSELFFSPRARRSRIAGPVELLAMSARALGARVTPRKAAEVAGEMGQSLFRPPSVKGWDGGRTWINAGTWLARHNHLTGFAQAHVREVEGAKVDLAEALGAPETKAAAAERIHTTLLPGVDDPGLRATLDEAARGAKDVDQALALCTALVLSSPEYHLV